MKNKILSTCKNILINYMMVFIYIVVAILIELLGAVFTDGGFYIKDARYMLTLISVICCIMILIPNKLARTIFASIILAIQGILNTVFIVLFEMAGQWFDFSMFSLRNDAMGILENVPVNFWFFYIMLVAVSAFLVFGIKVIKFQDKFKEGLSKNGKIIKYSTTSAMLVLMLILNILTGYSINGSNADKYYNMLYSNATDKYNEYGITNNFVNEIYSGAIFKNEVKMKTSEVEDFFYEDNLVTTDMFGISKGNNVITILGETFEWLSFMSDDVAQSEIGADFKLPNGMKLSKAEVMELYPNLWKFYNESYRLKNYHAREKTDISESYSILGSYPTGTYINYDYYNNIKPQSMPNMMRTAYEAEGKEFSTQYFHDGYADFYNRSKSIVGLGFDKCYTTEDMEKMAPDVFKDYGNDLGERNLDGEMLEACKDLMFPTDRSFYTYITTISTHGMYSKKRSNLEKQGYYDKLAAKGMDIDDCNDKDFILYSYLACAMELDRMIGMLFDELEQRNLLDKTTILLFGDHQGYYEGLSNYVKDIYNPKDCQEEGVNYMNMYRVPCMIYDQKLSAKLAEKGMSNDSYKFSSSCDIVPTLLDMLGIKYFSNMYFGNSIFADEQSVIYSRGYGYFLDEYAYFLNINNFKYLNHLYVTDSRYSSKQDYINKLTARADKLVNKIKYIDCFYKLDMYKNKNTYNRYTSLLKAINGWS